MFFFGAPNGTNMFHHNILLISCHVDCFTTLISFYVVLYFNSMICDEQSDKEYFHWHSCQPTPSHPHLRKLSLSIYNRSESYPDTLYLGHTAINSCYLQSNYIMFSKHWNIYQWLGLFQKWTQSECFLETWRHNPSETDLWLMLKKLGENVGQKLIMWSGKWGLYQDISQGLQQLCLHMLAQDVHHVIA